MVRKVTDKHYQELKHAIFWDEITIMCVPLNKIASLVKRLEKAGYSVTEGQFTHEFVNYRSGRTRFLMRGHLTAKKLSFEQTTTTTIAKQPKGMKSEWTGQPQIYE